MSRRAIIILLIILLATIAVNIPILSQPFGRDQGIFAYIGDGMRHGFVPYRDSWDHKPPGIDVTYFLAFSLFGRTMPAVHILETLGIMLGVVFVYLTGRRFAGEATGLVAAGAYGIGTTLFTEWWDRLQAEMWMATLFAGALWCAVNALHSRRRAYWMIGAGFGIGLALWFKPTALTMLPALAVAVLLPLPIMHAKLRAFTTRLIFDCLALLAGAILAFLPGIIYFAANGALGDLYEAVILFNVYHAGIGGNLTPAGILAGTLDWGRRMSLLGLLGMAGAAYGLWRKRSDALWVILAWLLGAIAGVWWQAKFFSYHWSVAFPPLCILAGYGLVVVLREIPVTPRLPQMRGSTAIASVTLPLLYAIVLITYLFYLSNDPEQRTKWGRELPHLLGQTSETEYLSQFGHNLRGIDVYSFSAALDTANYLRAHSNQDDTVLVWGFQALVNWLADRRAPTRYDFIYPLTFERPASDFRAEARSIFLHDLQTHPPKYIVLVSNDVNPLQTVDSITLLQDFPEFRKIIANDYTLEKDIADFHIYRYNAP